MMSKEAQFSTDKFRLDGKVAIITGGASGLGFNYTKAMLISGAKVVIASYDEKDGMRQVNLQKVLMVKSSSLRLM